MKISSGSATRQSQTGRALPAETGLAGCILRQSKEEAAPLLRAWYDWAIRSQVEQVKKVARTVKQHWDGILNYFDSKLSNGFLEGINISYRLPNQELGLSFYQEPDQHGLHDRW